MVVLTIDGRSVSVPEGTTILEAAASLGIRIPTLCYLKEINEIGACRVCVVEVKGTRKLAAACNTPAEEGMEVFTDSLRAREARKTNVELILSQHEARCPSCARNGSCALQALAEDLGIVGESYEAKIPQKEWDGTLPLVRDESKCIKCMRCIQICDKVQCLNVWDLAGAGSRTTVDVREGLTLSEAGCSMCGQCITHCPVGALRERDDTAVLFRALKDPERITVVQIAPAIRAAWGEALGLSREEATEGKLAAALRKMGFDYVFDTDFAADLTIMEEGSEFLDRLAHKEDYQWPMFTSCCPGWVRFLKSKYPHRTAQLSTAKSPQQMFGAVAKSYYAGLLNVEPEKIFCVSVMPCTAKKHECAIPVMNDAGAGQDVDLSITTREMDRLIRRSHINVKELPEEAFDAPLGVGTGAAVIFGTTGGVMDAALRSAYYLVTGENPDPDAFEDLRSMDGWKEYALEIKGIPLKVAVVSGLGNTAMLMEALENGEVSYDFVEVMACPGGCSGGGGQPIAEGQELAEIRGERLNELDRTADIRFSHENPAVVKAYEDYFEKPLSHRSHQLLHTDHDAWDL